MSPSDDPVLTPGKWDALLFGTDGDLRRFVAKLAIHHGHLKPTPPGECPVCGTPVPPPRSPSPQIVL
jgi:hypothetical protein